jgi:5-methylcytosine-specific restriction endonuclease McrA
MKKLDMIIGTKFNRLTLLEIINITNKYNRKERKGIFQCDCGNKRTISLCVVKQGKQKSCGCYKPGRLEYGESSFKQLYKDYKVGAKRRKRFFSLTENQFKILTKSNCYYCGSKPNQIFKHPRSYGEYIYNGIDRIDNNKNYTIDNCVTCCKICNICKGKLSQEIFMKQCEKITSYLTNQ